MIDANEHFNSIDQKGFEQFLLDHLNEQLNLKMLQKESDFDFKTWLSKKEILISLNKKDLLDSEKLKILNKKLENLSEFLRKLSINKISSISDEKNEIDELLDQLKEKVSNL